MSRCSRPCLLWLSIALLLSACLPTGGQGSLRNTIAGQPASQTESTGVRARSGDTLDLEYDLEANRGSVTLTVTRGAGNEEALWQVDTTTQTADTVSIDLPEDGTYFLTLLLEDFTGSYALNWRLDHRDDE